MFGAERKALLIGERKGDMHMAKVSVPVSNEFCPQCLYLYGTYKENGEPNYGVFCWATYCWDEGLKFVACIGENKLTRDRIRATGIFSASVVNEALLPAADYCGNHPGYDFDKSKEIPSIKGAVLDVPVPVSSPWTFELEVDKTLRLDERNESEIYICKIRNVLTEEGLTDGRSFEERLKEAAPVIALSTKYFPVKPEALGDWGQWKDKH